MADTRIPADARVTAVKVLFEDRRGGSGERFITLAEFAALLKTCGPFVVPATPKGSDDAP